MKLKPIDYFMIPLIIAAMIYNGIAISASFPEDPLQEDYDELILLLCAKYPDLRAETDVWKSYPEIWTAQQMIREACQLKCQIKNLFKKVSTKRTPERLQEAKDCQAAFLKLRTEARQMIAEVKSTIP